MKGGSKAVYITFDGRTQHKSAWAREFGMSAQCFGQRLKRFGGDMEMVRDTPINSPVRYEYQGKRITRQEIADLNGSIHRSTVTKWHSRGASVEDIIHGRKRRNPKVVLATRKKPEFCTHPDCDSCPYNDCKW